MGLPHLYKCWGFEMIDVSTKPNRNQPMNFNLQSLQNWYRGLLQNPKYRWWVVAASIVYLVSPIDLIPDFVPFVGLVDDTLIISLLVAEVASVAKLTLQSQSTRSNTPKADLGSEVIDVQAVTAE
jgi:uncharacterized membrane protein YkvA (DUF1232 family)